MAPKRKTKRDSDDEGSEEVVEVPKAKRPAKAKAVVEAGTDEAGWTTRPPSLIFKNFGSKPSKKIAAFDLDGTLVNVKSGMQFPRDSSDWKPFNKKMPEAVKKYHDEGFRVVIFTNQGAIKSALGGKMASNVKGRIDQVMEKVGVPALAIMATQSDENRKPGKGMWELMCSEFQEGVKPDLKSSFFIGDAAGRPADFSDSDRKFAEAIGIRFGTPEEEFGEMDGKRQLPQGTSVKEALEHASDCINADLVDVFTRLADLYFANDNKFKGAAFKKVAGVLASYPVKVEVGNLKEVGKLPGVGKGSLAVMKEYLETGKVDGLDDAEGAGPSGGAGAGGAGAGPKAKQMGADVALNFM